MELNAQDKEALKCMPKEEVSNIMDEWVEGFHQYTKNNRDWSPLEVMGKHFGPQDKEIKNKILSRAREIYSPL